MDVKKSNDRNESTMMLEEIARAEERQRTSQTSVANAEQDPPFSHSPCYQSFE